MARKTPKHLLPLFDRHQALIEHVTEVLRVKRTVPLENQANYIKEKPEEYWIGLADGYNGLLESALHESKCYAGFCVIGATKVRVEGTESEYYYPSIGWDHPEYAGWRRQYYIRGE